MGVAAVDARTGQVQWEAWRLDEVPAGASKEEKAAVEYLLALIKNRRGPAPLVPLLPDLPVKDLLIKNPWPVERDGLGASASEGKSLIYYRDGMGVIALDRQTKKEVWRLLTTRYPYPSHVLEAGENLAFIQIGSYVPATLRSAVIGGGKSQLTIAKLEPHPVKQRVAAAMLLHHYGDGYLRPELGKIIERLREEKNDPAAGGRLRRPSKSCWPPGRKSATASGCSTDVSRHSSGRTKATRPGSSPGPERTACWRGVCCKS